MASTENSAGGNYSFYLQSDSTLSADSPLRLENSALTKQKRRRTSPRDHAVLEAAYLRNSKPDKHERADIVNQVELGEKEVQIWFQNRRQNDRRKSKPLQPHELLAHLRNGTPIQGTQQGNASDESQPSSFESTTAAALDVTRPSSRSSSIHELLNPASAESAATREERSTNESSEQLPTPPSSFELVKKSSEALASMAPEPSVVGASTEQTHSRKRSHEVMAGKPDAKANVAIPTGVAVLPQPKPLARSSSFVRLAMTVDGAVKVRTNNEPTPSPPKQRVLPPMVHDRKRESFGRSQSAVENGFAFKDISPAVRRPGEAGFGRSRDARTWEFYCDRDSGDALSTQAEAERSGSAVGAINLIRSRSQRSKMQALSPNPAKQNARRVRVGQFESKPKFSRSASSMARLQTLNGTTDSPEESNKRAKYNQSPSGDSDKENWAPGTRNSQHTMRRTRPSTSRGSVLQENDFPAARDPISRDTGRGRENTGISGKYKAKGDDLDCIQGLLSLSQGAWR